MSSPSSAPATAIDFAALTDQLRILPTSVSWGGVVESIRLLRDRPPGERQRPDMQDHVRSVEGFAQMIRDHTELVAYALACGVTLARLAPRPEPGAGAFAALQTISSAYNFSALSEQAVHGVLRTMWTALRRYQRGEAAPPPPPVMQGNERAPVPAEPLAATPAPVVATSADVAGYFEWLRDVIRSAKEAPLEQNRFLAVAQRDAWASVLARYEAERIGQSEGPPSAAEAIVGHVQLPPAAVLGYSLRTAPAVAWASMMISEPLLPPDVKPPDALVDVPPWAPGIAAHALGFRMSGRATAALFRALAMHHVGRAGRQASTQEVEAALEDVLRRERMLVPEKRLSHALFVVRREADSLVVGWPTTPRAAVLPLTESQMQSTILDRNAPGISPKTLLPNPSEGDVECIIAVEQGPSLEANMMANRTAEALTDALRDARISDSRIRRVEFGAGDARPSGQSKERFRLAPVGYDDLILSGDHSARPRQSSSRAM